jgi:hypothetical protein
LLPSGRSGSRRHLVAVRAAIEPDDGRTVPWLSLPRLWVVVVLGAVAVMQLAATPSAIDPAYHVKAGELMVEHRSVLRSDPLAWPTAGGPWLDQNWGAQLLPYGIGRVGGFGLVAVAGALCTVAAWGLVAAACRRDGRGTIRFLVVGVLSVVGLLANPWGARVLACAVLLPTNRVVAGMVSEWAPASLRGPAGAVLLVSVGVLVVAVARSRPQARAPEQLLRMALLVGLALWAVRASVWFGLALPVTLCTLARERAPRPAGADRASRWRAAWCSPRWW